MELLRLAKDIIDRKANPIEYPCFMLGGTVARNKPDLNEILSAVLMLTYRSNFRALPRSNITSDKGWGCLIRTSQMLLARALRLHGEFKMEWFMDSEEAKLSIHNVIKLARDQRQNFEAGFWSPSQGCEAILRAVHDLSHKDLSRKIAAYTAVSGCVYLEDVINRIDNCNSSLLLLVPIRAVAHRCITQSIFLAMSQLLQLKQCCGIVGGVPNRSYYLVGVEGERFLYLDPHTTQPAYNSEQTLGRYNERASTLPAVSWKRIDSSILLGFYIRDQDDWLDFVYGLEEVRRLSSEQLISIQPSKRRIDVNGKGWDEAAAAKWAVARQEEFKASRAAAVAKRRARRRCRESVNTNPAAGGGEKLSSRSLEAHQSSNAPLHLTSSTTTTTTVAAVPQSASSKCIPNILQAAPSHHPINTHKSSADSSEHHAEGAAVASSTSDSDEDGTNMPVSVVVTEERPIVSAAVASSSAQGEEPVPMEVHEVERSAGGGGGSGYDHSFNKSGSMVIVDLPPSESDGYGRYGTREGRRGQQHHRRHAQRGGGGGSAGDSSSPMSNDDEDDGDEDGGKGCVGVGGGSRPSSYHKGLGDMLLLDNAVRSLVTTTQRSGGGGGAVDDDDDGNTPPLSPTNLVGITLVSDIKKSKRRSLKRRTAALWQKLTSSSSTRDPASSSVASKRGGSHHPHNNVDILTGSGSCRGVAAVVGGHLTACKGGGNSNNNDSGGSGEGEWSPGGRGGNDSRVSNSSYASSWDEITHNDQ